ncbi:MAG: hypothetical protein STSR0008_08720 [Ignavibacterium sp.]
MKFRKLFIVILLSFFFGCDDDNNNGYYSNLVGDYKATTFIEPGSNDAGADILQNGGYLYLTLYNDSKFYYEVFIPEKINSNYAPGKFTYKGDYTVKEDTISLNDGPIFLADLIWNKTLNKLETRDFQSWGPYKIILEKN